MSNLNPQCEHIIPDYILEAKVASAKATSKSGKAEPWIRISKKNIHNAFMLVGVPLSDQKHGIYCMAPPELLHTTREGISANMIEVTKTIIGDDVRGMRVKAKIEAIHQRVFSDMA